MQARRIALGTAAVALVIAAAIPAGRVAAQSAPPAPNTPAYYTQVVQPILQSNCYRCHGGMNHRGAFKMDTREGMYRGGKDGSVLTPGHPEQSMLIALIRHEGPKDDPMPMPPKKKLTDADIAAVTLWVKAGAVMP
jgi:mono/diheme cytochrome c family protein